MLAAGCVLWTNLTRSRCISRLESAEKGALFEELDNEKILLPVVGGTLPCHGTFSKFWELMGSLRNTR